MDLVVDASVIQLKYLFRLRDDVKSLLEEVSAHEMDFSSLLAVSLEFFIQHLDSNAVSISSMKLDEDLCLYPILSTDKDYQDKICSIQISLDSSETVDDKLNNTQGLSLVNDALQKLYATHHIEVNNYFVLLCTFKFILSKRMEIIDYFTLDNLGSEEESFNDELENEKRLERHGAVCEICGDMDLDPKSFCEVLACGKCITFFIAHLDKRLELTCSKLGNCRINDKILDISCKKCRMKRCIALSMIEHYDFKYRRIVQMMDSACDACDTVGITRVVKGVSLCSDCESFLKSCLKNKDFDGESVTQDVSDEGTNYDKEDKSVLLKRFKALGILLSAEERKEEDLKRCIGCDACIENNNLIKNELKWNGSLCKTCETFMFMSMTTSARHYYTCSSGELGRLCEILPNSDNSWSQKCNYCWFRILEMGGVVELWKNNGSIESLMSN
ncbi:uncharacterized protein [Lepeophtheirus salmonis]|uniref:uncharacterized protein n=1 Tax=Lepeophtheirus salmonis TaxID=72036 RepID=UPI001AEA0A3B|nr:uncharacterized protein LOC121120373 [Lepeophtheirus salmonis]XP_040571170.1 uncharacterized protein LOC121120373 [Lepeophtheirus salmonis]